MLHLLVHILLCQKKARETSSGEDTKCDFRISELLLWRHPTSMMESLCSQHIKTRTPKENDCELIELMVIISGLLEAQHLIGIHYTVGHDRGDVLFHMLIMQCGLPGNLFGQ